MEEKYREKIKKQRQRRTSKTFEQVKHAFGLQKDKEKKKNKVEKQQVEQK